MALIHIVVIKASSSVSLKHNSSMLSAPCQLEKDGGRIAISHDKFDKLITSLRTAVDNDENNRWDFLT
jgi:hypothetical protein